MKLQLINAPIPTGSGGSSRTGFYPPLGLLSIATFILENEEEVDIEILDGEVIGKDKIINSICSDIVGIYSNILSYRECIEIAQVAKSKGAKVIVGGPYVSAIPKIVLENREMIDAVVIGDGERSLNDYIKGASLGNINNLAYRHNGKIVKNCVTDIDLSELAPINYDLIDLEPYFKKRSNFTPFKKTISTYSQKGCFWYKRRSCVFCEEFATYRTKRPTDYWAEIEDIVKTYNVDIIFDVSDSPLSNKKWLRELSNSKPSNLKCSLFLYGRIDEINNEVVNILGHINCYEILAGIESGDNEILKTANKGFTVKDILDGARLLAGAGIKLYPSFVLGLPGETMDSLLRTKELVEKLVSFGNVYEISCSPLLPIPGSIVYNNLIQDAELGEKYRNKDILPIEKMRQDWVRNFCDVDYDFILEIMENILKLVPVKSSYGSVAKTV
jgi:anaerobic magnesium-protoporphyrin IX monomethyl ester cyclase